MTLEQMYEKTLEYSKNWTHNVYIGMAEGKLWAVEKRSKTLWIKTVETEWAEWPNQVDALPENIYLNYCMFVLGK